MTVQLLFGTSVAFGFIARAVVANLYIWPQLRTRSRTTHCGRCSSCTHFALSGCRSWFPA
jgi:hypothetical protein